MRAGRPWVGAVVTPLSVETCLEEPPEPAEDGVDEDVIWAVGVTVFLGGFNHRIIIGGRDSKLHRETR